MTWQADTLKVIALSMAPSASEVTFPVTRIKTGSVLYGGD
jgi:hypothetical protein